MTHELYLKVLGSHNSGARERECVFQAEGVLEGVETIIKRQQCGRATVNKGTQLKDAHRSSSVSHFWKCGRSAGRNVVR